jgi:hypothetical protein
MDELVKQDEEELLLLETYLSVLTDRQRRGLMKLARLEEIPETQAEIARVIGITERALYNWWNDENWCRAVYELMVKTRIRHLPAIESSLIKRAKQGSCLHQKGFYRLIGIALENAETNQPQVIISFTHEPG